MQKPLRTTRLGEEPRAGTLAGVERSRTPPGLRTVLRVSPHYQDLWSGGVGSWGRLVMSLATTPEHTQCIKQLLGLRRQEVEAQPGSQLRTWPAKLKPSQAGWERRRST